MIAKNVVRKYLKQSKALRDDDRLLCLEVWEDYGLILSPAQRKLFTTCPSAETIGRRRREMSLEFPPSKQATEKRFKEFKKNRDYYGSFWKRFLRRHA